MNPRRYFADRRRQAQLEHATRRLLLGVVLPTWIAAGLADWQCHRCSDIEHTAGTQEALIHAAMMGQAGVPIVLGLFAEINAGMLALVLTAFGLHQATAIWDVAYAESRREVTATEQHVHGILEQAPAMATGVLLALHSDQARALLPGSTTPRRIRLERKRQPIPSRTRQVILATIALCGIAPYAEEITRCVRAARTEP